MKQRGYIDLGGGFSFLMGVIVLLGVLSLLGWAGYGIWWFVQHVSIV